MNFTHYIIKGGIATPENPYYHNDDHKPTVSLTMEKFQKFEQWASANRLPVIRNVPDGVYPKEEFEPTSDGKALRLKEKKEPVKMVSVEEVVKVLEAVKDGFYQSAVAGNQMSSEVLNMELSIAINKIKSL